MEKADPISESALWSHINSILGFPKEIEVGTREDLLMLVVYTEQGKIEDTLPGKRAAWLRENTSPWWVDFMSAVHSCNLDVYDLGPSNWGMLHGKLVLIDYAG